MSALKITIMELESALAGRVEMCEGLEGKLKEKEGLLGDWKKGEVEKLKAEVSQKPNASNDDLDQFTGFYQLYIDEPLGLPLDFCSAYI